MQKVSVIVPAYNEEKYIGNVLKTIIKAKEKGIVDEILVVDDASRDKTVDVAEGMGVRVVAHKKNKGKGAALKTGLNNTKNEIVLFLDGDLVGLTVEHVKLLVKPLKDNEKLGMVIGQFAKTGFASWFGNLLPQLSGQRALKRELFNGLSGIETTGYGVDYHITRFAKKNKIKIIICYLNGLSQIFKEQKEGFLHGTVRRIKMYKEIFKIVFGG